jgi:bifunctional oligoribonuclease and PAP phosphatase NrnA
MDSLFKKTTEMIKNAKRILLVTHAKMDCDAMSSTIALFLILKKLGKNVTAVCADPVPESFQFLPSTGIFQNKVSDFSSDIIVTLDITEKKLKDIQWSQVEGKVNIVVSAEEGVFSEGDFSFAHNRNDPDLIISLDVADLQQLGKLYEDNSELFYRIPFLNIDHHVSNTDFGNINLVVVTNCSTTETLYDLVPFITSENEHLIDADIATLLLAGMITDTGSFQHANTTPKCLDTAADLIEMGARQQEIIKNLFKTRRITTLRLWGRILSRVQNDPIHRIVWSAVSKHDFLETESHSDETEGLIDELLSTTPGTEVVLLIKEREDDVISVSIRTSSNLVDAVELAKIFGGGGHRRAAGFKIRNRGGKIFEEICGEIISRTKSFQAGRIGLSLEKPSPEQLLKSLLVEGGKEEWIFSPPKESFEKIHFENEQNREQKTEQEDSFSEGNFPSDHVTFEKIVASAEDEDNGEAISPDSPTQGIASSTRSPFVPGQCIDKSVFEMVFGEEPQNFSDEPKNSPPVPPPPPIL